MANSEAQTEFKPLSIISNSLFAPNDHCVRQFSRYRYPFHLVCRATALLQNVCYNRSDAIKKPVET